MKKSQPIGIFDSGIGGLTVAKAISEALPNEQLIYFGDTEHMPYGGRSSEHILMYAKKIAAFLIEKGAKILVIACNSASAVAYLHLKSFYKGKIDVIGVIEPVTDYISQQNFKKIGIIGTKPTIQSKMHEQLLQASNPLQKVVSMPTPLLAPMIEEGFFNNSISQTIVDAYLSNWRLKSIDALVLACTHYPLIKKEIRKFYKKKIDIIDTTEIVAQAVKKSLAQHRLLHLSKKKDDVFYVSEFTDSFEKTTKIFYGTQVHIEEIRLHY
jgi:glutamate racemase